MMSWFLKMHQREASNILDEYSKYSRDHYPSTLLCGIELVAPAHYIVSVQRALRSLEELHPAGYSLVKDQIDVIYAHPKPMGWIGFHSRCAFMTDQIEAESDFELSEHAAYFVAIAKINQLLGSGIVSVLFKWSRTRKAVDELKQEVKSVFRMAQV